MELLEQEWLAAYRWDPETTLPDPARLHELGISELAEILYP